MKIITSNAAYVQRKDILYSLRHDLLPAFISIKVIDNSRDFLPGKYEFVKFDEPEEIEFFMNTDWIIDYNEIKNLSDEEIIRLGQSIAEEKNTIANKFNSMSQEQRDKNMNMVSQCELLDFKMHSLRDVLWFKQRHIKMKLPKEVDYPTDYAQRKGIKKLINSMFNKKNKLD